MVKTCFIISSIGKEDSEIRKISDEKYELVFEPVLNETGYSVTRSDKIATPGSISREIVQKLIESDLVIADVTDENPNVFYELAIRNAVKKSVIIFKKPNQSMPFDIYDKRAISIDRNDPRIWKDAGTKLRAQIQMAKNSPEEASESIISDFTFDISKTETLTDTQKIVSAIKDLKQEVRKLSKEKETRQKMKAPPRWLEEIRKQIKVSGAYHVSIPKGTGVPGCEENNLCFIPPVLRIKSGDPVKWTNDDTAAHTITSGTPQDGPTGMFDSSLFMAGDNFIFTFSDIEPGEYPYFCMVHPWQQGTIIVE